jgi:hypothetical protein
MLANRGASTQVSKVSIGRILVPGIYSLVPTRTINLGKFFPSKYLTYLFRNVEYWRFHYRYGSGVLFNQ